MYIAIEACIRRSEREFEGWVYSSGRENAARKRDDSSEVSVVVVYADWCGKKERSSFVER